MFQQIKGIPPVRYHFTFLSPNDLTHWFSLAGYHFCQTRNLPKQKFAKLEIRQTRILSNQSPTFVPTFEKQNISIHFFSDSNSKVFFSRRKKILQRQDFSKSTQISFGSIFFRFERKKNVGVKFSPSKKKRCWFWNERSLNVCYKYGRA